ncbi:response regulator [Methanococcoides sp. AM1]|uniref:response regulator n=1 Tax=Methanococcoides sp. AM1 TaxID=1201011 RepID=UPI001083FD33|nr:response regulator [Methanococcoides sp. AM1]
MKRKKIVVVEDESIIGIMFKLMLEAKGYSVTGMASKGGDAISLVETTRPDLVLMDIWLKGEMDGIETAMKIRKLYNTPIVFITADFSKETRKRADSVGHQAYLKKPIRYEYLEYVVHSIFYKSVDYAKDANALRNMMVQD